MRWWGLYRCLHGSGEEIFAGLFKAMLEGKEAQKYSELCSKIPFPQQLWLARGEWGWEFVWVELTGAPGQAVAEGSHLHLLSVRFTSCSHCLGKADPLSLCTAAAWGVKVSSGETELLGTLWGFAPISKQGLRMQVPLSSFSCACMDGPVSFQKVTSVYHNQLVFFPNVLCQWFKVDWAVCGTTKCGQLENSYEKGNQGVVVSAHPYQTAGLKAAEFMVCHKVSQVGRIFRKRLVQPVVLGFIQLGLEEKPSSMEMYNLSWQCITFFIMERFLLGLLEERCNLSSSCKLFCLHPKSSWHRSPYPPWKSTRPLPGAGSRAPTFAIFPLVSLAERRAQLGGCWALFAPLH